MFHSIQYVHALLVAPHLENAARPGRLLRRRDIYRAITPKKQKPTFFATKNKNLLVLPRRLGIFKRARRRTGSATTVCRFHFLPRRRPTRSTRRARPTRSNFQSRARARRPAPETALDHQPVRVCTSRPRPDACTGADTRYAPRAAGLVFLAVAAMRACRDFGVS